MERWWRRWFDAWKQALGASARLWVVGRKVRGRVRTASAHLTAEVVICHTPPGLWWLLLLQLGRILPFVLAGLAVVALHLLGYNP